MAGELYFRQAGEWKPLGNAVNLDIAEDEPPECTYDVGLIREPFSASLEFRMTRASRRALSRLFDFAHRKAARMRELRRYYTRKRRIGGTRNHGGRL